MASTTPRSQPTTRRRRTAAVIIFTVLALIAGLVFAATRAEGREVTRASANDGGAWIVNRELAAVAHTNRATGELSSFVRLTDAPTAEVHQAEGVVVVHDPASNQLFEVDARSVGADQAPTQLPEFSQIAAVSGAVVVFRAEPLTVWRFGATEIAGVTSVGERAPLFMSPNPGAVAAANDGTIAIADSVTGLFHRFDANGIESEPVALEIDGVVIDITIVDSSAIVLTDLGELRVVDGGLVVHSLSWDSLASGAGALALLQKPAVDPSSTQLPPASGFAAITVGGELIEIDLSVEVPRMVRRGNLGGASPLAPIQHDGCIYGVVTSPPTFGVSCDQFFSQPLDGAGSELRLRLVNGWIWVNDLENGLTFGTNEQLEVERLDDWAPAIPSSQAEQAPPEGADQPASDDAIIVEDPDAIGDVRDTDDFTAGELNEPPIAIDDFDQTRADTTAVVEVLRNDSDPNNDVITVVDVEVLSGDALVVITPSRNATQVTPATGFVGTIEYRYSISDGRSDPVSAIVQVVVLGDDSNQAPVAVTDVIATAPGSPATIDVLSNDSDPDGDAILLVSIDNDTGTLRWDPSGQVTFTPDGNTEVGWIEMPYVIADTQGAQTEGRVRVEIRDQQANQEPDARNDQATTVAGRPVAIDLLANDSDPDGDPLIVGSRPQLIFPDGASVETSDSASGEFVFSADEPGVYIFTYTVNDSAPDGSESDTARIRIDVTPNTDNAPPVAVRDDVVIPVGDTRTVYVLDNDGDPDGDVISIVNWQVSPGLLVSEFVDSTGHIGFDITLTREAGSAPTMSYSISDGINSPVSAPIAIAVASVLPQNQPPFANDDVREIRAGQTIEIFVLENDFDPEGEALRIVSVGDTDVASVTIPTESASLLVSIPDDAVSSFTVPYDIVDPAGNRAAALLRVQLVNQSAANRAPVARTDVARTRVGRTIAISVLSNDFDPDSDPIALDGIREQPRRGTVRPGLDGTISYTPDADFRGTDVFTYAIVDAQGDQALGEVFVGVVDEALQNLPPIAIDDSWELNSAEPSPLNVLGNDRDPEGDPLRVIDVTAPSLGTVTLDGLQVIYQPPASMADAGTDTFDYVIADSAGNQASATVTINLGAYEAEDEPLELFDVNNPEPTPTPEPTPDPLIEEPTPTPTPLPELNLLPIARDDDPPSAREGSTIVVDALANDSDPDGPQEALRIVSVGAGASTDGLVVTIDVGEDAVQIPYTIADEAGGEDSALINVVVTANQPPVVEPLSAATPFETRIELDLGAQVSDIDDDELFFVCCDNPRGGTVDVVTAAANTLVVTFIPELDFAGEAGFSYTVDDQEGHRVSGSVTINVGEPGNRAPEVLGQSVDVPQRAPVFVDLAALATDPDGDVLTYTLLQAPTNGVQVSISGASASVSAPEQVDAGTTGFFTYEVSDGVLVSEGRIDFLVLEGENRPPTVTNAALSVGAASGDSIDLRGHTTELDLRDSVTWTIDTAGVSSDLTVQLSGSLVAVTAAASASGLVDQIEFTATDTRGGSATGAIEVTVVDTSEPPPVANDDSGSRGEPEDVISIDVLANDSDPLQLGLSVGQPTTPTFGNAAVRGDQVEFTAGPGEVGTAIMDYTITDAAGRTSTATISVVVVSAPDTPAPPNAVATSRRVTLSWVTPQLNGSVLQGYRITPSIGEAVTIPVANSYRWDGLENGTEYTFTVTALSDLGPSGESAPSPPATPDQKPEAPSVRVVTSEDEALFVEWDEPTNLGSEITDYEIRIGGPITATDNSDGDLFFRWTGLENGDRYTFELRAFNGAGWGDWGPSSPAENPAAPPDPPTIGTTVRTAASGALQTNWTRPGEDNGDPIIEYFVESRPSVGPPQRVPGANSESLDWSSLQNGVEYEFRVQARNRAGTSDWSAWSDPVVPCGRPAAPVITNAVRGDREATISWGAVSPPGCRVTAYWVQLVGTAGELPAGTNLSRVYGGLTNGTPYRFTVQAENAQGRSVLSAPSAEVIPAGPPIFCPTSGTASATATAPRTVRVDWAAAIANGDTAGITDYELRIDGGPWTALGNNTPSTTVSTGLSNNTSYSFEVRARNTVDLSTAVPATGICGPVTARTWALPAPAQASISYDPATSEVTYLVTGGSSLDTPLTALTITSRLDGATFTGPASISLLPNMTNLSQGAPITLVDTVALDGLYDMTMQVCNAVGCVDSTATGLDVVVPKPPDRVELSELDLADFIYYRNPTGFEIQGMAARAKITIPDAGRPVPTFYRYELERRNVSTSGGWFQVAAADEPFSASTGFPWTILGAETNPQSTIWLDPLFGYSNHPQGMNNGNQYAWRVRVQAVNDVGEAPWSDWVQQSVGIPSAFIDFVEVAAVPCRMGSEPSGSSQCHKIDYNLYGYPANTTFNFSGSSGDTDAAEFERSGGNPENGIQATTFCSADTPATDANGRIFADPGPRNDGDGVFYTTFCVSPRGASIRLNTGDGYTSPWHPGVP